MGGRVLELYPDDIAGTFGGSGGVGRHNAVARGERQVLLEAHNDDGFRGKRQR
jgi:hypothetical protein